MSAFIDRSLQILETDALDLLQLHCPPTTVYYRPEVFEALDDFVKQGKLRFYGVSVEKVEEALKAIEYPGVQTMKQVGLTYVGAAPSRRAMRIQSWR